MNIDPQPRPYRAEIDGEQFLVVSTCGHHYTVTIYGDADARWAQYKALLHTKDAKCPKCSEEVAQTTMNPAKYNGRTITLDTIQARLHGEVSYIEWLRPQRTERATDYALQCIVHALTQLESDIIALKGANNQ